MMYCDSVTGTEIPISFPNYNSRFVSQILFLNTNITVLKTDNFINFPSLVRIIIRNSQLSVIEDGAFNEVASSLQVVDFTNSKLNMINPRWFLNMTSLEDLILSENCIEFVPANSFTDLIKLQKLKLDNNLIKRIHRDNLQSFNSTLLTEIDIGRNSLICDCYIEWLQQIVIEKPSNFSALIDCEFPSNVTGIEISLVLDLSSFCLGLCLEVICTENSHCMKDNEFPKCVCNSGFDPIGNGTYECTPATVTSSTILPPVSSATTEISTTSTSIYSTSTGSTSTSSSQNSIQTTTILSTITSITTVQTSIHSTTVSSTNSSHNTIPTSSASSIITLSPISISTTIPVSSIFSSHHFSTSSIPNSNNNSQLDIAVTIWILTILLLIALLLISWVLLVIVWGKKRKRIVGKHDQPIGLEMMQTIPSPNAKDVIMNQMFDENLPDSDPEAATSM
ncbi:Leucine-rich repeats and immunoglobulin-like domains protein 2 [Oopsacas minuta]|uniref:Leucine-rich repeats and immunoglobulin-like domains protein 2 n=1 Tax=Oopsacas minuta TaxID=111878 RepID=A0AAV7JXU1_9METZ|nr:Leucine-rich repeats and immunoglobulin-like domains protein 2 [Oopsacas minuta]